MKHKKNWATFGCVAALMAAACATPALAQDRPSLRVWSGEQPPAEWLDPRAEAFYVARPPADAVETRRIERLMDRMFDAWPSTSRVFNIIGARPDRFQPQQPEGRPTYGIILRLRDDVVPLAYGGACGRGGHSRYLTAPAEWFDRPSNDDWASTYPELSLAMAVGWRQVQGYCDDRLGLPPMPPGQESAPTPASQALNSLGAAMGYVSLRGGQDRFGHDWGYFSGGEIILRSGIRSFDREPASYQNWTGLARSLTGVRRVDAPLFEVGANSGSDVAFWALLGWGRQWDFLNNAFLSRPDDPASASSVREWLDAAMIGAAGQDLGLARALAKLNWSALIANGVVPRRAEGRGVFARDVWQGAMVDNGVPGGCFPINLSMSETVREVDFTLREASTNCIVVRWSGEAPTYGLPPIYTLIADAGDGGVEALEGLHLTAHQVWRAPPTRGPIEVEYHSPVDMVRPGTIVEDTRTGEAVKSWTIIHNPDPAFADEAMTIAFTNLHPAGEGRTRTRQVRLTVGPGAHQARQAVRARAALQEGDCDTRDVSTGVASEGLMAQTSFHIATIDPADFSINGYFIPASTQDLMAQMAECARVQTALGTAMGARPNGERPDGPNAVCQGTTSDLTALGASAMAAAGSGNLQSFTGGGALPASKLEFRIEANGTVSGPGRYPARLTGDLVNAGLQQQGLILPTSIDGDGEIVVERSTSGSLILRYQASFSPPSDRCSATLSGTLSGTLHSVVALPLTPPSARALTMPPMVEQMGEQMWSRLSAAERATMSAQARRVDPEPTSSGDGMEGAAMHGFGCDLTDAQVEAIITRLAAQMPAEVRGEFLAQLRADRAAARYTACVYKDVV